MENSNHHWPVTVLVRVTNRRTSGFGIIVKSKSNNCGLVVAELVKDGEAYKTGLLRPGDIILKINDQNLNGLPYEQCLQVLQDLPVDEEADILLRVPDGYTTRLVTTFSEDGRPKTTRYTTVLQNLVSPVQPRRRESISEEKIRRLKNSLDQSNLVHNSSSAEMGSAHMLTPLSKQNGLTAMNQMSPERPATLSAK